MPGFDMANPTALYVRDQSHGYLSPHVQVSFPVTDRTNFRLSYSHQVQAPDFGLLLGGINIDLGNTNTNQVFGSDLDFGKTIAFEFGIRHAFSDDMVLDVAAYNKDIVSDPAARLVSLYDPAQGRDNDFRILTNLDFGNVRGLDIRLDRRFGNFFNGTIGYAYQQAKNTGSDPFTYTNYGSRIVNQVGGNNGAQPPPQGILPTDDSRPHALTGALSMTIPGDFRQGTMVGNIFRNVSVFSTFRYTSGTAYTKCGESNEEQSVLSIENCVRLFPEGLNTQRLPAFKELNARLTKSFGVGGLDMTGYLDVRNLLNFRNVLQVFAVNGDIRNDRGAGRRIWTPTSTTSRSSAMRTTRWARTARWCCRRLTRTAPGGSAARTRRRPPTACTSSVRSSGSATVTTSSPSKSRPAQSTRCTTSLVASTSSSVSAGAHGSGSKSTSRQE